MAIFGGGGVGSLLGTASQPYKNTQVQDVFKGGSKPQSELERALGFGTYKPKVTGIDQKAFGTGIQDQRQQDFVSKLAERQQMADPRMQAAQIDQRQQAQFRGGQQALAAQLMAQSMGQGPSLAQSQLQQGTDRNLLQSMAMAASQRGTGGGAALRGIQQNQALMGQQYAQQAAQLRAQEQMAARDQLSGVLSSARGQDIGLASSQADLNQGANQQNLSAALAAQAQRDQMAQFYNSGLLNLDQSKIQSQQDLAKLRTQTSLDEEALKLGAYYKSQDNINQQHDRVAKMLGSGASAIAASDERLKDSSEISSKDMSDFLSSLGAHKYTYKNKKFGGDEYISPMAQEIEKTKLGKGLVHNTPGGKMVNYARAGGVMLSAASMLNQKVASLEEKLASVLKKRRS